MLKRVRLNSQFLFVCWAKVKGKTRSKRTRRKELIVRRSFTFGIHSVFDKKKISLSRPFASKISVILCPEYLFFAGCTHWASSLRTRILTLFYCRRSNTNKKKKASKKGPRKRESLGESYVVHRRHRRPFSSSRAKKKKSIYLNLR